MKSISAFAVLCLFALSIILTNGDLLEDILSGKAPTTLETSTIKDQIAYNRNRRPRKGGENSKDPLDIEMMFALKQIISIDEKNQLLTTSIWLNFYWTDPRLSWNSTFYDFEYIVPKASQFWLPDLAIMNTASGTSNYLSYHYNQVVIIDSNGTSYINIGLPSVTTRCRLNVWKYPFDEQLCGIVIGSWQRSTDDIRFAGYINKQKVINADGAFVRHVYWHVKSYDLTYQINDTRFIAYNSGPRAPEAKKTMKARDVVIEIGLERKPLYIMINSIFPSLVLNVVILLAFPMSFDTQIGLCKLIKIKFRREYKYLDYLKK